MTEEQYLYLKSINAEKMKDVTRQDIYFLNGVLQNKQHPETFDIPTEQEKKKLRVGDYVKLFLINTKNDMSERMWFRILKVNDDGSFLGLLDNDPFVYDGILNHRDEFMFQPEHVVSIYE